MADQQDPKVIKEVAKASQEAAQAVNEMNKAFSDQIEIAKSLNDTYKQFKDNKFVEEFTDFTKSFKDMTKEIEEVISKMKDTKQSFKDFTDESKTTDKTVDTLSNRIKTLSTGLLAIPSKKSGGTFKWLSTILSGTLSKSLGAATGAVVGLFSGFEGILSTGKMLGGFFTNAVSWAFQLAGAIIAIPVRFLGGLVEMAANMNLHMTDYLRNIEEVREKFGNFKVGQSQAIKAMQAGFAKTTETGLNSFRIYGTLAERLKFITELVEGMGAQWSKFSGEMSQGGYTQAKRIDEFRMGLGLSNEQLKTMLTLSSANGKSATKTLIGLTKHVKEYAKTLNMSHKDLAKDIADAVKDAGKFGGTTIEGIARASAYARGLGHELKEIAGVLDAFETFDTAAEGAAKLAQSFGATVDAFKLVSAQSPDEMVQTLRDSMFAAGKSADLMTRQELKLLASQSGLSEEVARSVFSMKNQGKSVEELSKIQSKQEDAQVTQAHALKSLAEDIRRLVKEMEPLKKTFVAMFIDGMKKGITYSKDFVGLMMEIRQGLMMVWREGFKLGKVLLSQVPALKAMMDGLRAFFEPKKFQMLASKMRVILLDFFKGSGGVSSLLHDTQDAFTNFFNIQNPAAKQMLTGAKMILTRLSIIFAEGLKWVGTQMATGIQFLADVISGKQKIGEIGSMAGGSLGFLQGLLSPIIQSLVEVAPLIGKSILNLLVVAGEKTINFVKTNKTVQDVMQKIGWTLMGIMVTGIATRAIVGAVAAGIANTAVGAVGKAMSGGLTQKITDAASKTSKGSGIIGKAIPKGGEQAGGQTGSMIKGWVEAAIAARQVTMKDIGKLLLVMTALGAGLALAGVAFAFGIKKMAEQLSGLKFSELLPVFASLGVMIVSIASLAGTMSLIGKISDPKSIGVGALALGAAGLFLSGMVLVIGLLARGAQAIGLKPEMMNATGSLLESIAKTMLLMIPVMIASAAMGALLMGPQGILIAAATAIGFAAIATAVRGLAGVALAIVVVLNQMPLENGLDKKAQAFTSIMESINQLVMTLTTILRELSPGFTDFLSVIKGGKITDRIEKTTEFVNVLMPSVQNLVIVAKDAVMSLSLGTDIMIKSASIFASILGSVGGFMKAIVPTPELLQSESQDFGMFSTKITKTTGSATDYIRSISSTITGFMKLISGFIEKISNLPLSPAMIEKGIPAISGILSAVGTLMTAIIPSPETIKQFKTIESKEQDIGMFSDTTKKSIEKMDTKGLAKFLEFTTTNFNVLLKTLTSENFKTFLSDAANIVKNPQQLKSIEVVGSIMSSIGSIIKSVSDASKMPDVKSISNSKNITINFSPNDINRVLQDLANDQGGIAKMFDLIVTLSSSFAGVKDISSRLENVNKVFSSINQITGFVRTMMDSMKQGTSDDTKILTSDVDRMMAPLATLDAALERMSQTGVGSLNQISTRLMNLVGDDGSMKMLKQIADQGTSLSAYVKAIKTNVIENGIVPAMEAVKSMTTAINQMDEAMSNIQLGKKKVTTGLQGVASSLGVGGRASYTIQNKPINIHLEIQVEMKAAELERTIIFRKESVIRDQLRWIRGSEQGHEAFKNNELSDNVNTKYIQHVTG